MCCQLFGLLVGPEHTHDGEVVLGGAAVQQELVVGLGRPVALVGVLHVDGEVLPVGLDQVLPQGVGVARLGNLVLALVPANTIG